MHFLKLSLVNARLVANSTNNYFYYYSYSACGCYYIPIGNYMLLGKHLNKRRKSESISQLPHNKGIELKELNCPQKSAMSRPLSSTPNNSLKSMSQRELLQLPNTSQDQNLQDSPLLQYY